MSVKGSKTVRRQFDPEFKQRVVDAVLKGGFSRDRAAKQNDLAWDTVNLWIRQHQEALAGPALDPKVTATGDVPPASCARLRRENQALREENNLLLRTAALLLRRSS